MSFVGGARAARRSLKPMELEQVGATLRSFVSKSGALQAVAATPLGIVTCDGTGAVFFQETDEDEPRAIDVKDVTPATDDEIQFVVSGRDGEGVVVVIGDESFTMGEDWPPKRPVQ
jgi:hypothetical protein